MKAKKVNEALSDFLKPKEGAQDKIDEYIKSALSKIREFEEAHTNIENDNSGEIKYIRFNKLFHSMEDFFYKLPSIIRNEIYSEYYEISTKTMNSSDVSKQKFRKIRESLGDVLKPKEGSLKIEKQYVDEAMGRLTLFRAEIKYITSESSNEHTRARLLELYKEIDKWFLELPELIKEKFADKWDSLLTEVNEWLGEFPGDWEVNEAMGDVLKPKEGMQEVLNKHLEEAEGRIENYKDLISSLKNGEAWEKERLKQIYNEIENWFLELPDAVANNKKIEYGFNEAMNMINDLEIW